VNWMWLLKAGSHGDYNPQLVSRAAWAGFEKVWSDLSAHRIDLSAWV
jgi:basic membrane protein A